MATPIKPQPDDRLLTEVQAADYLRMSSRTLQAWRSERVGPPFIRAGRAIRYRFSSLVAWTHENTVTNPSALAPGEP